MSERSSENDSGQRFVLENQTTRERIPVDGTVTVGRGAERELVLDCVKCSRFHAEFRLADGELWVEDQGSTNGSFVNNEQIDGPTPLKHGDSVQFGDARFRVIDAERQPADRGGDKTVIAGRGDVLGILGQDPDDGTADERSASDEKPTNGAGSGEPESELEPEPEMPADAETSDKPDGPEGSGTEERAAAPAERKEPEAAEPAEQEPGIGAADEGGSGRAKAAPEPKRGEAASERSKQESEQESKPEPKPPSEQGSGQPAKGDVDPAIPRSWADAEQLEQASHTSMLVGDPMEAFGQDAASIDPDKAIAQARKHVGKDLPILVGLTDPVMGTMFELTTGDGKEKWEIGRGKGADIEIDAESVSGRHSQLVHENGRWKIVNMMSVNGTFVNERKVLSAYLQPGDVIRMGGVKLVFDARVRNVRARLRSNRSPAKRRSGIGRLFTAPFRWIGRLFSRGRG